MRQRLIAPAILGVILGCSPALAAGAVPHDAGGTSVDTWADTPAPEKPDAGETIVDSVDKKADTNVDAPTDEIGIIKSAYASIRKGDHVARELAALALILVGILFRRWEESGKYKKYLPGFFKEDRGRFILVTLLTFLGALGHQALAGSFVDWSVWQPAVIVLAEAVFGYVGIKKLLTKKAGAGSPA